MSHSLADCWELSRAVLSWALMHWWLGLGHLKASLSWASKVAHSRGRQLTWQAVSRLAENIHRQALHVAWSS